MRDKFGRLLYVCDKVTVRNGGVIENKSDDLIFQTIICADQNGGKNNA